MNSSRAAHGLLVLSFVLVSALQASANDISAETPDSLILGAGHTEPAEEFHLLPESAPPFTNGPSPESDPPGTLLQWSSAEEPTGGPDLDEPLVTDRPDFTEASVTVGQGVTQIEFGYTYTYDSEGNTTVRTHSFGEPLLRVGAFADWFEFRIALPPLSEKTTVAGASDTTSGLGDLYLGAKLALTGQVGLLPEMAITPQTLVPTGSAGFSSDSVEPGVNWLYSWDIDECWSTGGSTQINRRIDGGSREGYAEIAQSWTIGRSWTDELGSYAEWFVIAPVGAETEQTQHYFNGGFTYLVSNDVQFDIRAGRGLNRAADDYFVGAGLSVRYR